MSCRGPSCSACFVAAASVALQGCVGRHHVAGRGAIDPSELTRLEVGTTTREEVIVCFGEPSGVFEDESVLFYQWAFEDYAVVVIPVGYAGAGEVSAGRVDCLTLFAFDEEGVLERRDRRCSAPTSYNRTPLSPVEEFGSPEGRSPSGKRRPRFILNPAPSRPATSNNPLSDTPSLRVKIAEVTDERGDAAGHLIGQRRALGVATHDIYLAPGLRSLVREAIAATWEAAGHAVVQDDPDVTVTAHVTECKIATPGIVSWSAVATLDITIEVLVRGRAAESATGRYRSRRVKKTMLGPSEDHCEEVMSSCLQDVMCQMASDTEVARYLQQLRSPSPGESR